MNTSRRGSVGFCSSALTLALVALSTSVVAADNGGKRSTGSLRIEILPGERDKWVDPVLAERVPVAVFGEGAFDVHEIDPATLVLAGAAVTKNDDGTLATYRDVDGDGLTDLIVQFASRRIRLSERSTQALLSGRTIDGRLVTGSGAVASIARARAEQRRAARVERGVEKLPPIAVQIDVLPGDPQNVIELGNRGTVPVAILSAPGFDATKLEPAALHLAGSPVTRRRGGGLSSFEDVNGDGRADLVVEVPKALLKLDAGSDTAVLTGSTAAGRILVGRDRVSIAETATMTFDSDQPLETHTPPGVDFANDAGITINDNAPATPYPSTIAVAGLPGVVSKVRVTLKRLNHTFPDDIDILLVGPTGQSLILMSDVGGAGPVTNVTLTFDDDSAFTLDNSTLAATGTYRPVNVGLGDTFPAPAPAPTLHTTLSAFDGTDPNGTWKLFIVDDAGGDFGTFDGGWSVDFVLASEFCTAGPITINDLAPATPYPSTVTVAGLTGVVNKVTAVFRGLTHTFPDDIDSLLIAPTGQPTMVMSDTGGTSPVAGVTLVIDDNAALSLDPLVAAASGTYAPVDELPGDSLPAPAPASPYPSVLSVFNGINPNGVWKVFIADDAVGDVGSVTRFCVDITTMTPVDDSNPQSITIPMGAPVSTSGMADPYPSTIDVTGVIGTLVKATVTVRGLTHTFPQDVDMLVTNPTGGSVLLMSDVSGGLPGVAGVTYTFDDDALASLPPGANAGSGTYKPTNDGAGDTFPFPAPAGPYGATLSGVTGLSPNGLWNLWVVDDAGGDVGSIAGGWTLTLRTQLVSYGGCSFSLFTIPAGAPGTTSGAADVYPSGIIEFLVPVDMDQYKVTIDLLGVTHTYPLDLDVLLVGPQGQKVLLMSDAGGQAPGVNNVNLSFDDDAASGIAQFVNPTAGTYRPTDFEAGDVFPGPAPAGPYATSLSAFKGTNPLGGWALYVVDDATSDVGSMTGWCLNFVPSIDAGEVPNLRFTDKVTLVWDAGPNATSYVLYRGTAAQLPALADHGVDSCQRGLTLTQQFTGVAESPAPGALLWYLVRGDNAQGQGSAGFERFGAQVLARIEDSSGSCP